MGDQNNWLDLTSMVSGLQMLHRCTTGRNTMGICHTFYGSAGVREAFLAAGGRHAVMFRNIIQRTHSALCHHSASLLGRNASGVKFYEEIHGRFNESDITYGEVMTFEGLNPAETLFLDIVLQFVMFDLENWQAVTPDEIIIFEKAMNDTDYLIKQLGYIVDDDVHFLRNIIEENRSKPRHQHSQGERGSDDDWFFMWPESFRRIFMRVLLGGGVPKVRQMYEELGYMLTPGISQYIDYVEAEVGKAGGLLGKSTNHRIGDIGTSL